MQSEVEPGEQLAVEVFVRDLQRALTFYRRLGFADIRIEPDFAELEWQGHTFMLDERTDLPAPSAFPQANMRILVPDVDAYWQLVNQMGARVIAPIADRDYGLRDFTIADPDGFGLRFASRIARNEPLQNHFAD